MTQESVDPRVFEAREWVRAELERSGILERAPREAWLETLSDAYLEARAKGQGIDPGLVRLAVQAVLDQTPSKGKPWNFDAIEDSEDPHTEQNRDTRSIGIWTFRNAGRPVSAERKAADIVHLVASVIGHFGLPLVGTTGKRNLHAKSACRVVAEVLKSRGEQPRSPRRVLEIVERRQRERWLEVIFEDGFRYGSQFRENGARAPSGPSAALSNEVAASEVNRPLAVPSAAELERLTEADLKELLERARISEQRDIASQLAAVLERRSDLSS